MKSSYLGTPQRAPEVTSHVFLLVFAAALAASVAVRLWLAMRQAGFVRAHRENRARRVRVAHRDRRASQGRRLHGGQAAAVDAARRGRCGASARDDPSAAASRRSSDGRRRWTSGPLWRDVAMFAIAGVIYGAVNLPFSWWHTFRIEERFGFNRMTMALWLSDLAKGLAVAVALGLPLLVLVLWLMRAAGPYWWLWAWGAWMAFQLLVLVLYPTVIAPLFNKFTPMEHRRRRASASSRCSARCGFRSAGSS
jgi:STE24 endopeptidase